MDHRGNFERASTREFQIRWLGYDNSYDSWEPWANIRDSEALHRYLIAHNMKAMIPRKFRENYP